VTAPVQILGLHPFPAGSGSLGQSLERIALNQHRRRNFFRDSPLPSVPFAKAQSPSSSVEMTGGGVCFPRKQPSVGAVGALFRPLLAKGVEASKLMFEPSLRPLRQHAFCFVLDAPALCHLDRQRRSRSDLRRSGEIPRHFPLLMLMQGVLFKLPGCYAHGSMRDGFHYKFWVYILSSRSGTLYVGCHRILRAPHLPAQVRTPSKVSPRNTSAIA